MKNVVIGIDLGGTNLRVGVVNAQGKVIHERLVRVGGKRSQRDIVSLIAENVSMFQCSNVSGIGIGAPGIVDFKRGIVISSPHYPDWHNFKLRDELSKKCGLPVALDNDANMVALGEAFHGAGLGFKNFIMVTLGTGIGGGIIINGEIFHGDTGFAGEIGHLVLEFNGRKCDCGGKGCFETIMDDASKNWKNFGRRLGAFLASLANVTGIFSFVIGGGVSNAWGNFIHFAKKEIAGRTYKETAKRIKIKRALLGDNAGVIGSAMELFKTLKPQNR